MKTMTLTKEQQELVMANMEFAGCLALKLRHCGVELEDLQQEAYLGLCIAAMRYDSENQEDFRLFAYFWCRKMMLLAISRYGNLIYLPRRVNEELKILNIDVTMEANDTEEGNFHTDRMLYIAYKEEERQREYESELA